MKLEILINQGLGDLRFGMTPERVKATMGEPSPVDDSLEEISMYVQRWSYEVPKISLVFHVGGVFGLPPQPEGEKYLVLIGAQTPEVTLCGEHLYGRTWNRQIAKRMTEWLGSCRSGLSAGDQVIEFDEANLRLSVRNRIITHVQWTIAGVTL